MTTTHSPTLAVFGVGPGFGLSVARRFGREGFRVALVARDTDRLDTFVKALDAEGITAAAFPADLLDRDRLPAVLDAITDRFGPVDVLEYSPGGMGNLLARFTATLDTDVAALEFPLDLLTRAPITLIRAVLPGMIERGAGGLLVTQAVSAIRPLGFAANAGAAMAATRSYLHNLHVALAEKGVYVGTMTIGAVIGRSAVAEAVGADPSVARFETETLDPDELADRYWRMYTTRDQFEEVVGSLGN